MSEQGNLGNPAEDVTPVVTMVDAPPAGEAPGAARPRVRVEIRKSLNDDQGEWLLRLICFAVIGGSLAVMWWSFTSVLGPAQKASRELGYKVSKLAMEVD